MALLFSSTIAAARHARMASTLATTDPKALRKQEILVEFMRKKAQANSSLPPPPESHPEFRAAYNKWVESGYKDKASADIAGRYLWDDLKNLPHRVADPNNEGFKTWRNDAANAFYLEVMQEINGDEEIVPLREVEGMPLALARLHFRAIDLFKHLGIPQSEWDQCFKNWDLSPGYETLEWCLPNPPPFHCFDELPIIKHLDGPVAHH